MVPELKELIQNYDQLGDFQKGKLFGSIVGKYGLDIFLAKQSVAFLKSLKDLKKANKTLTLDALASSEKVAPILVETEQRWAKYQLEVIRNGEVKIHEGRQGKHILEHKNYKDAIRKGENPSIFIHSMPEELFIKFAGTGIKEGSELFGMAGYKEIVDFKEFIGYSVTRTGEKTATTLGKIHYAKDGVHIVPFIKR